MDHNVATPDGIAGGLGHRRHLDPPLQAQPRLDGFTTSLGMADAVQVRPLFSDDTALVGECLADLDPGLEPVHPVELRSSTVDPAAGVHDRGHRQVVPHADLEVVGVVSGSDFDCAGAEFGIDVGVGDHDDLPVLERVRQGAPHQIAVALVVGMHGDRGVAEHGFDSGGGHHDVRLRVLQ